MKLVSDELAFIYYELGKVLDSAKLNDRVEDVKRLENARNKLVNCMFDVEKMECEEE